MRRSPLLSANPRPHNRFLANGHRRAPFALILPSNGRVAALSTALAHSCADLRGLTIDYDALHRGRSLPARRTNRSRSCGLDCDGSAAGEPGDGGSAVGGRAAIPLAGSFVENLGLGGNSALDQLRVCSANADVMSTTGARVSDGASSAVSKSSVLVPRGMSKFGASPFATDDDTSVANLTSGRSHEPR